MFWVASYILIGLFLAVFRTNYNGMVIEERLAGGAIIAATWPVLVLFAILHVKVK